MIKKIISTTALAVVALVGLNTDANARVPLDQPCVKVNVGGFFKFAGALIKKNNDFVTLNGRNIKNRRGDLWMDAEVIVKAEGQAECFKYGAEVQLEANPGNTRDNAKNQTLSNVALIDSTKPIVLTSSEQFGKASFFNADKVYMYVSNDYFGRVEAGATDSAMNSLWGYVNGFGLGGVDGPWEDFLGDANISSNFKPKTHDRALKVYYVTNRYEGVQFGTSWAPVVNRKGRAITRHRVALTDPGTGKLKDENFENSGEYAVNYTNTFCDSFGVNLSAGFSHAHPIQSIQSHEPWRAWGLAGMFSYAGFSVSGTYANNGKSGYFKGLPGKPVRSNTKETAITGGLQYECGPYVIGTNYLTTRTAGDTTVVGTDRERVWAGGATYKAAQGLSLFVEGVTTRRRLAAAPGKVDKGSMALLGSRVDW